MKVNTKEKIDVEITPIEKANQNLIWKSSNENIVKVDKNGTLNAVGKGEATVKTPNIILKNLVIVLERFWKQKNIFMEIKFNFQM